MKKHSIILSAILLTASVITGCTNSSNVLPEQDIQTETTCETTAKPVTQPPKNLVEIDPFEGLELIYHHTDDGLVEEKSFHPMFGEPTEMTVDNQVKSIQLLANPSAKGLEACRELGCRLSVYRDLLPQDLKEGDTVTLRLLPDADGIAEKDLSAYTEEMYGIRLKQTAKNFTVHFEEEPLKEIDPFENAYISFTKTNDHYTYEEHLKDSTGDLFMRMHNLNFRYTLSLAEGNKLTDLFIGDKLRYTLTLTDKTGEYTGEDINKHLEACQKRFRFTQTEKIFEVIPNDQKNRYSQNVNVMLNRPADWYEIVSDKKKLTKYDLRHIDGSTATIPITAEMVRQFCNPDDSLIEYYIDHNTTGPAYENLIKEENNKIIILVTEPSEEELAMAAEYHVELEVTPIALDGFVFITHKDNPVDSLTVEQIQGIYSGEITNWAEVGGNDEEIVPYQREQNSGSQTVMENIVMNGLPMTKAPQAPVPIMTMGELIERVAAYKNDTCSLGYTFYYYLNNLYQNEDVKVLNIDGISPENENLLDQSYPFSSGYFAVTRKGGDKKGDEIKAFLLSDEGQELIRLAGYCPIR